MRSSSEPASSSRKAGNRRDSLPLAAFRLALDADDAVAGTFRNGFLFSLFADALGLWPAALGADPSGFGGIDQG